MCCVQVQQARQLDRRQKEVLELGLHYAKRVVTHPLFSNFDSRTNSNFDARTTSNFDARTNSNFDARTNSNFGAGETSNFDAGKNSQIEAQKKSEAVKVKRNQQYLPLPTPPLVIVHGGAGSGKSRLIASLYEMMTDTLQKAGDDPGCPYVLLTSFTGAASANINGQTLHSTFGFKFGTTFLSMPEKQRDEKRALFRNLRCLIVDEISMVSADMLYNIDLRLREITGRLDTVFGGISVFVFGDLFQLQPPKARYVFEEPTNQEHALSYRLRDLWKLFTVVNLEENHRQGEDKVYGDLLNRVRTAEHTEEDVATLETRVCQRSDPSLDSDALHVYGTNAKVNARNDAKLDEIEGPLIIIKAKTSSRTVRTFPTNKSTGCIMNTPFMDVLRLKIGCKVVLVHNVDTLDGLTNGCRGVLVDVEKRGDTVQRLVVQLDNPEHGRLARQRNPCKKFPQATYIDAIHWTYLLGGATATVFQFPVKAAEAITSHKMQASFIILYS